MMGNYDKVAPSPELLDATARLLAWRLDVAHLDPSALVRTVSGGGDRFAAGVTVEEPMIAAHRDYGSTACPGALVYAQLDALRAAVVAVPGLRIWDPLPQPLDPAFTDGPVRVSARLSAAATWTVSILDRRRHRGGVGLRLRLPRRLHVARPRDRGTVGDLTYKIEATGASGAARPATGRLDGRDLQTPGRHPERPARRRRREAPHPDPERRRGRRHDHPGLAPGRAGPRVGVGRRRARHGASSRCRCATCSPARSRSAGAASTAAACPCSSGRYWLPQVGGDLRQRPLVRVGPQRRLLVGQPADEGGHALVRAAQRGEPGREVSHCQSSRVAGCRRTVSTIGPRFWDSDDLA